MPLVMHVDFSSSDNEGIWLRRFLTTDGALKFTFYFSLKIKLSLFLISHDKVRFQVTPVVFIIIGTRSQIESLKIFSSISKVTVVLSLKNLLS